MKKSVLYTVVILSFLILGIGGYALLSNKDTETTENGTVSTEGESASTEEEESESEVANPASVFCEENGGTLEIENQDSGQVGFCIFDDGSQCEEWAYYNGECFKGESLEEASE